VSSDSGGVLYSASTNAVPAYSGEIFNRHCRVRSLPIENLSRNGHVSSTDSYRCPQGSNHVSDVFKSRCSVPALIQSDSNEYASNRQLSSFDFSAVNLINDDRCLGKGGDHQFDASQQSLKLACH